MAHNIIREKPTKPLSLLYFAPPFFRADPQLTERLEEAINSQQSSLSHARKCEAVVEQCNVAVTELALLYLPIRAEFFFLCNPLY